MQHSIVVYRLLIGLCFFLDFSSSSSPPLFVTFYFVVVVAQEKKYEGGKKVVFDDASRLFFENREKGGVFIETDKLRRFALRFFLRFLLIERKKNKKTFQVVQSLRAPFTECFCSP